MKAWYVIVVLALCLLCFLAGRHTNRAGGELVGKTDTFIHVDTSVEWAQDNSVPVSVYKKSTRSAKEFQQLAREVMDYGSR